MASRPGPDDSPPTPEGGPPRRQQARVAAREAASLMREGAQGIATIPRALFKRAEARRVRNVLAGDSLAHVVIKDETGETLHDGPALKHLHWINIALRQTAWTLALVAVVLLPAPLAAAIAIGAHALSLAFRPGTKPITAARIGVAEGVLAVIIGMQLGNAGLNTVVIVFVAVLMVLTFGNWYMDMEMVTINGYIIRTSGILWWKHNCSVMLTKINLTDVSGPFATLGLFTVDTASSQDRPLHNWGIIQHPAVWRAVVQYLIQNPKNQR